MGLIEKIEEIRKKPEHIRLRYVWFLVIICMIFIIVIWFFSFTSEMKNLSSNKNQNNLGTSDIKESSSKLLEELNKVQKQKETLEKIPGTVNSGSNNINPEFKIGEEKSASNQTDQLIP